VALTRFARAATIWATGSSKIVLAGIPRVGWHDKTPYYKTCFNVSLDLKLVLSLLFAKGVTVSASVLKPTNTNIRLRFVIMGWETYEPCSSEHRAIAKLKNACISLTRSSSSCPYPTKWGRYIFHHVVIKSFGHYFYDWPTWRQTSLRIILDLMRSIKQILRRQCPSIWCIYNVYLKSHKTIFWYERYISMLLTDIHILNKANFSLFDLLKSHGVWRIRLRNKKYICTYIPLTLYPRIARGISDIPPICPRFTKII
jgi:hypothetical protein